MLFNHCEYRDNVLKIPIHQGKTTCKIPRPHSKSRQSKCNETACHFICLIKWHSQPNQKQRCSCFRSTALIRIIEISKFNYSVACEWMCIWSLLFSFLYLPPCTRHSSYKNANFKSVSLWHTFSFSAIKMCVFLVFSFRCLMIIDCIHVLNNSISDNLWHFFFESKYNLIKTNKFPLRKGIACFRIQHEISYVQRN